MNQYKKLLLAGLLAGASLPVMAIEPFRAVCEDTNTAGYRYIESRVGEEPYEGWNDGEKFMGGEWEFVYGGGNELLIDGNATPVLAVTEDTLLAANISPMWSGVSSWTYVVNLGAERIVASNASALSREMVGNAEIKTRSTSFDCEFTY